MHVKSLWSAACFFALVGCSGPSPSNPNPTQNNTPQSSNPSNNPQSSNTPTSSPKTIDPKVASAYPVGLALASPLEVARSNSTSTTTKPLEGDIGVSRAGLNSTWSSRYTLSTARINDILSGATADRNAFDAELFFAQSGRARCFGPSVKYENHPDFVMGPSASGELPGGDLGLWTETEAPAGEACAAAQVNRLMAGARDQSLASLMGLAALISVATDSGTALPAAGASISLTSQMNALGVANITFSTAELAQASTAGTWNYTLEFAYTRAGHSKTVRVELTHATSTDGTYSGTMSYRITGDSTDFPGGNCGASSRTLNGSLRYEKHAATDVRIQARSAVFCGANVDGRVSDVADAAYHQVDPSLRYPTASTGWSENFNLFVANYNPEANSGDFVFAWQAGGNDSNTRVFQAGINATEPADGEAYFGYGNPMATFDGTILGLICNWAGPGSNHTVQPYAQRQALRFDDTTGIFTQPTGGSDIVYAPTNSCEASSGTSFNYDKNGDGVVDSSDGVSAGVTADLLRQDTAASVAEAIANRGFDLPGAVGGWPSE